MLVTIVGTDVAVDAVEVADTLVVSATVLLTIVLGEELVSKAAVAVIVSVADVCWLVLVVIIGALAVLISVGPFDTLAVLVTGC